MKIALVLILIQWIHLHQSNGQDFNQIYNTTSKGCTVANGYLIGIHCSSQLQVHYNSQLLSIGAASNYTGYYTQTIAGQYPLSYSLIDLTQKISYISSQTIYSVAYEWASDSIKFNSSDSYQVANLQEAVHLNDVGIYKDTSENQIFFRDRKRKENLSKTVSISSQRINFRVKQNKDNSDIYDLLVCTKTTSTGCQMHQIVTNLYPNQVQINQKSSIALPSSICGGNLIMTNNFIVISCPTFSGSAGQIQVYTRSSYYNMGLILTEIGNSVSTGDYFLIGNSIEFQENNDNHATLFYTSTLTSSGKNYTYLNTVQILKFTYNGQTYYRTLITVNQFRQTTTDSISKGQLKLSLYLNSLLMSYDNIAKVYQMPTCPFNQYKDQLQCKNCDLNQFVSYQGSSTCEICELSNYTADKFQYLIYLVYCGKTSDFNPSQSTQQSQKVYLPFTAGSSDGDNAPLNVYKENTSNNETEQNGTDNGNHTNTGNDQDIICDADCQSKQKKSIPTTLIIIIVCSAGGGIILIAIIIVIIVVCKRKQRKNKQKQQDRKSVIIDDKQNDNNHLMEQKFTTVPNQEQPAGPNDIQFMRQSQNRKKMIVDVQNEERSLKNSEDFKDDSYREVQQDHNVVQHQELRRSTPKKLSINGQQSDNRAKDSQQYDKKGGVKNDDHYLSQSLRRSEISDVEIDYHQQYKQEQQNHINNRLFNESKDVIDISDSDHDYSFKKNIKSSIKERKDNKIFDKEKKEEKIQEQIGPNVSSYHDNMDTEGAIEIEQSEESYTRQANNMDIKLDDYDNKSHHEDRI